VARLKLSNIVYPLVLSSVPEKRCATGLPVPGTRWALASQWHHVFELATPVQGDGMYYG
jgi:hypothetical protein